MLALMTTMTIFSLSMSISPGPVNMAIATSGANHGVWRTLPFVTGATLGFTVLLLAVGLALRWVADAVAALMPFLACAGALFIAHVGWKIATSEAELRSGAADVPSFLQGWLLQWLNPKAWIACASGAALFSDPASPTRFVVFAAIYCFVCYLSLGAWAVLGHQVSFVLTSRRRVRFFNVSMGGMLVGCAVYLFVPQAAALL